MQVQARKIVVLGTGGTIAGQAASARDNLGYTAAQLQVADLLAGLDAGGATLVGEQVAQLDSKDMGEETWQQLAARCSHWLAQPEVQGLVVTHGTDTLEETAYLLHRVLAADKPVVLTGAMRPASSATPDGPRNLRDALAVAAADGARGVVAVFAGEIHGALDLAKRHTYREAAFGSGDAGALGYVEEGRPRMVRPWPAPDAGAGQAFARLQAARAWPRVEIVLSHAGASGRVVQALLAAGVDGLVAAGTGNGTLHRELESALLAARAAGVPVVRSSRCAEGRVLPQAADRIPVAEGLSPVKARIALMLELLR